MENNVREDIMDLDLNQEPSDSLQGSVLGLGSLLNELESAHGRIEERIRQLEAVTLRARHRQRRRQDDTSTSTNTTPQVINIAPSNDSSSRMAVGEKFGKKNSRDLIAKALGMDEKKAGSDSRGDGGFYDCNICLRRAKEPILTCCGHLYCWSCFYEVSYCYSNVKECPVCNGEVTDKSIVPIYGNGDNESSDENNKERLLKVPPRPGACRVEGLRQQVINTIEGNESSASRRLIMQGDGAASSFSSLSSALNSAMASAERLVENLETFIHSRSSRSRGEEDTTSVAEINTTTTTTQADNNNNNNDPDDSPEPRRRRLR